MKKYLIRILLIAVAVLIVGMTITTNRFRRVNAEYKEAIANIKNYDKQLNSEKKNSAAFQLTIGQLEYFQDSILKALDETRKELMIKDKNLRALQAIQSEFRKKDTIKITQVDTLFKEPSLSLDTLLEDKWYSLKLGLRYPSTIITDPSFTSDKHVIVSSKKETVEPPKKFFLLRWFQKKHIVLNVDVIEKNPYVQNETSKYVEILK